MLNNFKITTRLVVGFGVLLMLIAINVGLAVWQGDKAAAAVQEALRTANLAISLKDTLLSVRQARVYTWTYAATGDETSIKSRDAAFADFKKQIADVDGRLRLPEGKRLVNDYRDAVVDFEAKALTMNRLKAEGFETTAPEYTAAVSNANDAAKAYAEANGKASAFEERTAENAAARADGEIQASIATAITAGLTALVVGIAAALIIGRGISVPITAMTRAMQRLANGDLSIEMASTRRHDEIGAMAEAVVVFKENFITGRRLEAERRQRDEAQLQEQERERKLEAEIVKQVTEISAAASRGDLDRRIDLADKDGFMRQLCETMNNQVAATSMVLHDIVRVLSALAQGDLDQRIEKPYEGIFRRLQLDTNTTAERLKAVVGDINGVSGNIMTAAREVAAGSTDLSERTEQQASNLEETASAMQEMAATVKRNADNAANANDLAVQARDVAVTGGDEVSAAIAAMSQISTSANKISDIVGMIDEIAFQTNLLALNAAVEAARAGDAGKGFAVVAQEVRSLAQRAGVASKDIKTLIAESTSHIRDGVALVSGSGKTLETIITSVRGVADLIGEIALASREQATGLEQINIAVTEMEDMTQRNAALVEESSAAGHSLSEQASQLTELMAFFNGSASTAFRPAEAVARRAEPAKAVRGKGAKAKPVIVTPLNPDTKPVHADWFEF